MQLEQLRQIERDKYTRVAYVDPHYRMGSNRKERAFINLEMVPCRTSYLDVSTGRGEMLDHAKELGFSRIQGTEIVPDLIDGERVVYADAWALPFADGEFDVVSCMDVIEHILPEDEARTLAELNRVAKRFILITANNRPSRSKGVEFHVNRKPYADWHESFTAAFDGEARWLPRGSDISETWLVTK